MAKVQYHYVEKKTALSGASGTFTTDLPEKDFIPEITIRFYRTTGTNTNGPLPVHLCVSKIEIVDGAQTIVSLTGEQAKALMYYRGDGYAVSTAKDTASTESYDDFVIKLGGVIDGVNYAPDFGRFSNPQLKVSWDTSITSYKGVSYDAISSPSAKLTVLAKIVREGQGLYTHGYIKSAQIYTWTQGTSTTTDVEIPRDAPLLGLMLNGGYDGLDLTEDFEQIKLDFDTGNWVPLHLYEEEIIPTLATWFPKPVIYSFQRDIKDDIEVDFRMGYVEKIDFTALTDNAREFNYQDGTKGIGTVGLFDSATPSEVTDFELCGFKVKGHAPFHSIYIPMSAITGGKTQTIDTKKFSRIILRTVSGASASTSSTPQVVAEYLIK